MKRKPTVLAILGVLSLSTAALAGPGGQRHAKSFKPIAVSSVDVNGDGMISADEFHAVMKTMRQARRAEHKVKRAEMLATWDANNDGKLDKSERGLIQASRFAKLDANGDGSISLAEAAGTRLEKGFAKLDADGNGSINETELASRRGHKGKRGKRGKRGERGKRPAAK